MRKILTFLNISLVISIVVAVLSAINTFLLDTKLVFSVPVFNGFVVIPSLAVFVLSCCLFAITVVCIIVTKHEYKSHAVPESTSYSPVYASAVSETHRAHTAPVVKEKIKSSMKKPEPMQPEQPKSGAVECPVCGQFVPEGQNVCVVCNTVVRS